MHPNGTDALHFSSKLELDFFVARLVRQSALPVVAPKSVFCGDRSSERRQTAPLVVCWSLQENENESAMHTDHSQPSLFAVLCEEARTHCPSHSIHPISLTRALNDEAFAHSLLLCSSPLPAHRTVSTAGPTLSLTVLCSSEKELGQPCDEHSTDDEIVMGTEWFAAMAALRRKRSVESFAEDPSATSMHKGASTAVSSCYTELTTAFPSTVGMFATALLPRRAPPEFSDLGHLGDLTLLTKVTVECGYDNQLFFGELILPDHAGPVVAWELRIHCQCGRPRCKQSPMAPPEFEQHAGRGHSKSWRQTIRVPDKSGKSNMKLGTWLEAWRAARPQPRTQSVCEFCRYLY